MRLRDLAVTACVLATLAGAAFGQSFRPFVIKDIRVEGLQRTEPGTVFSYLPVKVGETMTEAKAQQALRTPNAPRSDWVCFIRIRDPKDQNDAPQKHHREIGFTLHRPGRGDRILAGDCIPG